MELMRLFLAILWISSIFFLDLNFNHSKSVEKFKWPKAIFTKENLGFVNSMWDGTQYVGFVYSLSRADKQKHQAAVYNALENLPDLKVSKWFNKKKKIMGAVRVVASQPISGGYCRYYQVVIQKKKKIKHRVFQACKYINSEGWSFRGGYWGEKP